MQLHQLIGHILLHSSRMEPLIAELAEQGLLRLDELVVKPKSIFKRAYSKDITAIEILKGEKNKSRDQVLVDVSREGLYDALPEFLFHQPEPPTNYKVFDQRIKESERTKEEEAEAREFFLPFEQEFFRKKLEIEQEERNLFSCFSNPLQLEIFQRFWTDVKGIDEYSKSILFFLLPLAQKIAGNIKLMELCFSTVLGNKVEIQKNYDAHGAYSSDSMVSLGEAVLGDNLILGLQVKNELPSLTITIGPVDPSVVPQYLPGGGKQRLKSILFDYFVPIEYDKSTNIELERETLRRKLEVTKRLWKASPENEREIYEKSIKEIEERIELDAAKPGFLLSESKETALLGYSTHI